MNGESEHVCRYQAQVLACLRPGYLTVFLGSGSGLADGGVPTDVPVDLVPLDLRLPNSEFTLLFDRTSQEFVGLERQ